MAKDFIFSKRVNGVVEKFYPKTSTHNVTKEVDDKEVTLDDLLDDKGKFAQYSETVAEKSTETDLMFEVLGDIIGSEKIETLKGTIVSPTEPADKKYMWLDNSGDTGVLKFYNEPTGKWTPISLGNSGSGGVLSGIGTVISDTEPSDTNCLWLDTSDSNNIKFYDTTTNSWRKTNGDVTLAVNNGILTANYDNGQST